MAFELFEMLESKGSKKKYKPKNPTYSGKDEDFLTKVVTPVYKTIAEVVCFLGHLLLDFLLFASQLILISIFVIQEAKKSGEGKHSEWRNYDDLNEYFWYNIFKDAFII